MNIEFTVFKQGQPLKMISVELPVVIGRGTDSTLTIKHPLLSRRHCEVYNENGQVLVKDLASLNGTFVNNARVETALPLTSGSQLKLGTVEIQVSFEGGAVTASADADFEMGAFGAAGTEAIPVVESAPADAAVATFDLGNFEVNESAVADQAPAVDDTEFDLADFEVSTPEVPPAAEAQVELPSLMELAGGLDEVPADPPAAPVASDEAAPAADDPWAAPAADDPWAPPAEKQVNADDDDLDAFLADLG